MEYIAKNASTIAAIAISHQKTGNQKSEITITANIASAIVGTTAVNRTLLVFILLSNIPFLLFTHTRSMLSLPDMLILVLLSANISICRSVNLFAPMTTPLVE